MNGTDIQMPVAKAASAITVAAAAKADVPEEIARAAVYGASDPVFYAVMSIPWSTIASIAAVIYTTLLIGEWWWKKLWRPLLESWGVIKPQKRYVLTAEEWRSATNDQTVPGELRDE